MVGDALMALEMFVDKWGLDAFDEPTYDEMKALADKPSEGRRISIRSPARSAWLSCWRIRNSGPWSKTLLPAMTPFVPAGSRIPGLSGRYGRKRRNGWPIRRRRGARGGRRPDSGCPTSPSSRAPVFPSPSPCAEKPLAAS